jgi:hypothetical protein
MLSWNFHFRINILLLPLLDIKGDNIIILYLLFHFIEDFLLLHVIDLLMNTVILPWFDLRSSNLSVLVFPIAIFNNFRPLFINYKPCFQRSPCFSSTFCRDEICIALSFLTLPFSTLIGKFCLFYSFETIPCVS